MEALQEVTKGEKHGLLCVVDELRKIGTPTANSIASHIQSIADYDFAHLLFSDGTVEHSISLDKQLNIIQVADLVLPDCEDRKSTRLNSSHVSISYAVFCLKKKIKREDIYK